MKRHHPGRADYTALRMYNPDQPNVYHPRRADVVLRMYSPRIERSPGNLRIDDWGAQGSYPKSSFLHSIPGSIVEKWQKTRRVGFDRFRSEVNAMNPAYAKKLGILIRKTDVGAQKIDGSYLDTFSRLFAPGQAGKGLILPGDLSGGRHQNGGGPGDAFPHPQ